jgi:hypothetical protein
VVADLRVELHLEDLAGAAVAPQAADPLEPISAPEVPEPDQVRGALPDQRRVLAQMPAVVGLVVLERVPDGIGDQLPASSTVRPFTARLSAILSLTRFLSFSRFSKPTR